MNALLPVLFLLVFVSCAIGLGLHCILLSRLRSRHPLTWEALGRPTLFFNNSIANGLAVQRFLWRREYATLGDSQFSRFAAFLKGYMLAYLLLFILTVGAFVSGVLNQR